MTQPRQVLPEKTYLITRRTSERRFFLKPVPAVGEVFGYLLAVASERHGVRIHAFACLSTHFHLVVSDPEGTLPDFMQLLDGLLARALNSWWGRWENFWAPQSYSRVELLEGSDVIDKMVYTLANPVSSGLVERASRWPGPLSGVVAGGEERTVYKKPRFFFRPGGRLPDVAVLRVVRPAVERDLTDGEFSELLRTLLEEREADCRREMAESGRTFLGAKRVLSESPFDAPRSHAPRRGLNPRIAGKDKWRRIEALQRLESFLLAYHAAWEKFRSGVRDVLFPAGTYWLRRFLGVHCEPAVDAAPT